MGASAQGASPLPQAVGAPDGGRSWTGARPARQFTAQQLKRLDVRAARPGIPQVLRCVHPASNPRRRSPSREAQRQALRGALRSRGAPCTPGSASGSASGSAAGVAPRVARGPAGCRAQGAGVAGICATTAVPALAMALGSAAVSMGEPSEGLQAKLQRFSAGLLVGAVMTEIFPILKQRLVPVSSSPGQGVSWSNMLAAALGFGMALLLMYSLKALDLEGAGTESGDEARLPARECLSHVWLEGGDEDSSGKLRMWLARLQAHSTALCRLVAAEQVDREAVDEEVHGIDFLVDSARRLCRGAEPMDRRSAKRLRRCVTQLIEDIEQLRQMDASQVRQIEKQLRVAGTALLQVHSVTEQATFRRWAPQPLPKKLDDAAATVPWGLVVAVVIDSIIDGMLIGLAGAVDTKSGWLMATATTFEMGFLGYAFACSILKAAARPYTAVAILGLPPVSMLVSAAVACLTAGRMEHHPAFSGLIAFAMVALLFLVFQELLLEAQEKEDGEAWHISLWLYAGLLLSINVDMIF